MTKAEEILRKVFNCEPKDDLQLEITLNPELCYILQAMKEIAELAFDAGDYMGYDIGLFGVSDKPTKQEFIQQTFNQTE